jgi:hypothetical protein
VAIIQRKVIRAQMIMNKNDVLPSSPTRVRDKENIVDNESLEENQVCAAWRRSSFLQPLTGMVKQYAQAAIDRENWVSATAVKRKLAYVWTISRNYNGISLGSGEAIGANGRHASLAVISDVFLWEI